MSTEASLQRLMLQSLRVGDGRAPRETGDGRQRPPILKVLGGADDQVVIAL